jgi:hypothetical protein
MLESPGQNVLKNAGYNLINSLSNCKSYGNGVFGAGLRIILPNSKDPTFFWCYYFS